jgi:predicted PurR-regulated permease PerM
MDTMFVAPGWLRDIGTSSWLALGFALLLTATIALLALTATIVIPLIIAAVIAAVASPVVAWMQRRGLPRGAGTIIFVLAFIAFAGFMAWAVMAGIVSQAGAAGDELRKASNEITAWLAQHGIHQDTAGDAQKSVESGVKGSISTLLGGVVGFIGGLSSIVFGLAMVLISLIFLLKDGPIIRRWVERHMAVPDEVAHIVTGRTIGSLRGYFLGVTIIAVFNAVVVGIGAFALGIPLVATIALVTFVGAYVPFLGAWIAGAFSALIALGTDSTTAVIGIIVIQLLANGMLQQMVQPIAYGAALGIHPLAALVATIGGGCLFGSIGLILGAPLVSAAVRISADLANARVEAEADAGAQQAAGGPPPANPAPA